ncbi:MAG: nickel-dependent lactate racemase [Acidobacteria bacterium]|nr:nickel-dependent lactate racemase [Acidobacteriota bacterium]
MKISFQYPGYHEIDSVEVPDANLLGVYAPRAANENVEEEVMARGFERPHGAPRLRDAVKSTDRILILIDDGTRGTPISLLLHHVLRELWTIGVLDQQIVLLTAQGTHREMSEKEIRKKLGEFYGRFKVYQHYWLEDSNLHDFGRTSDGTLITANRLLREADFVIGLGSIVPHRIKGFSGGAKIVFPGISGREMQERNQWEAAQRPSETVMGVPENSMRLRIEEAARIVGLRYIVNTVSDRAGKIVGCFVGDPIQAHRAGCKLSEELNAVSLPQRADIVLIDSYPSDRDLWQSAKAFYSGTMAVRDGGTLIVVSPNPEGVADNHSNLLRIGYRPFPEIVRIVEAGEVDDIVGVSVLGDLAQIVDRCDCILVSPGVTQQNTERLDLRYAATAEEALELAFNRQGRSAKIAVLNHGGHVLPCIAEKENAA